MPNQSIGKTWGRLLSLNKSLATVDLVDSTYKVGRDNNCALSIPLGECSKEHFVIRRIDDVAVIEDVSTNGTFVNGTLYNKKKVALTHLSEIEIKHDYCQSF
jgi:pSer/pThr/pTyr-binding forkhead associated (FHA) protein